MSAFTDPLQLVRLDGPDDLWLVPRDIHYYTDCADTRETLAVRCRTLFVVPKGFITDGATIPRIFWTLVGHPFGRYVQAAVLHDYLYRTKIVSRVRADALLREAMAVLGVEGLQRWSIWIGVRIGGWVAYGSAAPARG